MGYLTIHLLILTYPLHSYFDCWLFVGVLPKQYVEFVDGP